MLLKGSFKRDSGAIVTFTLPEMVAGAIQALMKEAGGGMMSSA
jgi:hypothetical protein